ncbi:MAG: hypothetical protein ACE5LB_15715, partial [Acidiferrobacterales bacterium]
LKVLRSAKTDIDQFHLIESFCLAIEKAFGEHEDRAPHTGVVQATTTAEVIPLDKFRYRRFTRWA